MGKYVRTIGEKKLGKAENYACQICRASREICERCQTTGYLLQVAPQPVDSSVRRGRPRPILPVYN
jgi:hypothetical protein